jgi:hypothetical protein
MKALRSLLFLLAFSLLNAHELDAMRQQEWRILVLLRDLEPSLAAHLFVLLHIPLVALLLWLGFHPHAAIQRWARRMICGFGAIHVGLHASLRDHPAYSFDSLLSQGLILGYGLAGLLFLLIDLSWHKLPSAQVRRAGGVD